MQHFCLGSKEESVHRADRERDGDITIRIYGADTVCIQSTYIAYILLLSHPWTISQLLHPFLSPETFSTSTQMAAASQVVLIPYIHYYA